MPKGRVAIAGGGIAALSTAIALAEAGYLVDIYEQDAELCSRSSNATPCRIGVGPHYPDLKTAMTNLHAAIELKRQLRAVSCSTGFEVTSRSSAGNFEVTKGVYALEKGSYIRPDDAIRLFEMLREEYRRLVAIDPANEVLGSPDDFFQVITDHSPYAEKLNVEHIETIIETCETILDWPVFKSYLLGQVYNHPNINIHTSTVVTNIEDHDNFSASISYAHKSNPDITHSRKYDFVVNATWENIEQLQPKQVANSPQIVNRVKCMAVFKCPPELLNTVITVAYGPYCALTVRPDGYAYLTFEPVTNVKQYLAKKQASPPWQQYTNPDKLSDTDRHQLAMNIVRGATRYFPALQKVLDAPEGHDVTLKVGVVRTPGFVNIRNTKDPNFIRTERGVATTKDARGSTAAVEARKWTYGLGNGQKAAKIVEQHQLDKKHYSQVEKRFTNNLSFFKEHASARRYQDKKRLHKELEVAMARRSHTAKL